MAIHQRQLLLPAALVLIVTALRSSFADDRCNVFEPFRLSPNNARFIVGGPFPLHQADCSTINVDVVQELLGVQWAFSHWNQNPENLDAKIGI